MCTVCVCVLFETKVSIVYVGIDFFETFMRISGIDKFNLNKKSETFFH